MKKKLIRLLGVGVVISGSAFSAIFQEGFEFPVATGDGGNYNRYEPEQTVSFENSWLVKNVDLFHDPDGNWRGESKEGDQYIDLACSVNGFIETEISLDAGDYQLSFWLAGNFYDGNNSEKSVDVIFGLDSGTVPSTFNAVKSGQDHIVTAAEWVYVQSGVFSLTEAQILTLTFDDTSADTDPWAGAFIDDIQIAAVPEPATIGLLGLAGVVLFFRRRFMK